MPRHAWLRVAFSSLFLLLGETLEEDEEGLDLRRLQRAERILRSRVGSDLMVVLEAASNERNSDAVLRTCEALGIQHVSIIKPARLKVQSGVNAYRSGFIARTAAKYLTIRWFEDGFDCSRALKSEGYVMWATDLSENAEDLLQVLERTRPGGSENSGPDESSKRVLGNPKSDSAKHSLYRKDIQGLLNPKQIVGSPQHRDRLPKRLAIVFGSETSGVSPSLLSWADRRIYYPLYGFTQSLNLGVAAGIVLAAILNAHPELHGSLQRNSTEMHGLRSKWYMGLARTKTQQQLYPSYIHNPPEPLNKTRPGERCRKRIPKLRLRAPPPGIGIKMANSVRNTAKNQSGKTGWQSLAENSYATRNPKSLVDMKPLTFDLPKIKSLEPINVEAEENSKISSKGDQTKELSSKMTTDEYYNLDARLNRAELEAYGDPVAAPTRRPHPVENRMIQDIFREGSEGLWAPDKGPIIPNHPYYDYGVRGMGSGFNLQFDDTTDQDQDP